MPANALQSSALQVAILSDTHGHLCPAMQPHLAAADWIVHAGDFDTPEVFGTLQGFGKLTAVRGNMDSGAWARRLPAAACIEIGHLSAYVIHDVERMDLEPHAAGLDIIICGHTHRAAKVERKGVIYLNPGSASCPRVGTPPSAALLDVRNDSVSICFIDLTA